MTTPKIAVVFYSTYGTNHAVALDAAAAAKAAGAEVRLLQVAETAPAAVVAGQEPWAAQQEKMKDIPVATPDDMLWADGYFFAFPTRFGSAPSQMRAFIDTLGGVWSQGGLANKAVTASTSAGNAHGGQESTLLSFYQSTMHWGSIIVAPGYTDAKLYESGGNPYGTSVTQGDYSEAKKAAVAIQAKRLVDVTAKLIG
ncbi:NAD(P)H-dependent oxidoreductase [Pseudooceanicola sp. CBS1P-1]|uniref:NAD(P)H:quinone oxidoreductase, type IV n=1 Tax=Pseudooceanicola albus TaxID=2692189 RepID=A0A6L7G4M3_9RHOB|nr:MULTISPECIES: NAD(P)H-dependent oxidoreductase [Pseudooceanicola]MBT9384619.1 NAD(P)H-dependent oxidoreductase [Pseudooceanicola endophyticus]MXN18320.1 NAD(P)H:quinone oxidoreductase, type IV [Pseudooceanicola albus]